MPSAAPVSLDTDAFLRLHAGGTVHESLQTAIGTYVDQSTGRRVSLVGAVHFGDGRYYRALQEVLDGHEVVLFEGVQGATKEEIDRIVPLARQKRWANTLGLQLQIESIDYTRPHFRRADLSWTELKQGLGQHGVSPGLDGVRAWIAAPLGWAFVDVPYLASRLPGGGRLPLVIKRSWARLLAVAGREVSVVEGAADGGLLQVVILDRNNVAFRTLSAALDENPRSIALFYGTAHLRDMERRLTRIGFQRVEMRWLDAWQLGTRPA